jgi:hypothetical protein
MEVDHIGVHAAHCCKICGCKYGDEDCPVVNGVVEAKYDCYDCEVRVEDAIENLNRLTEEQREEVLSHFVKPNKN